MSGRLPSDHSRTFSQSSLSLSQPRSQPQELDSMSRHSASGRSSNPNVFSDDYSLDPVDSEQPPPTPRSPSISSIASSNTLRSPTVHRKPSGTVPNDSDVTENPFGDEAYVSFDENPHRSSLPQKGADISNQNSVISTNASRFTPHRSQSTSSRFSLPPRALSPYAGATGPSHPYAMYPQVGVSRSPSVTTTSTVRPTERPLGDSNAPQHPYAMYSQNVILDEGVDSPMDNPAIPLGFPGHNQTYQRPPGRADDDIGDLVGPDGHTEQLPPYSRYPNGFVPKLPGTSESANDAGDAGITPHEIHHTESENPPVSETSSRTLVPGDPTSGDGNNEPEEAPVSGLMAFEEKLKRTGKKRVCCGLPVWTLVLVGTVMFVAACIGGVIGGVLGARREDRAENAKFKGPHIITVTATPTMDGTPISSAPANLLPVPTGEWAIPAARQNQSKFCVADSDYTVSWNCMASGQIPIYIDGTDTHNITFESDPLSPTFTYGAQAPILSNPTQPLNLMGDNSNFNLGPALAFFALFDKLVIVPQNALPSYAVSKRAISERDVLSRSASNNQVAQAGDRPWFCWWNSTVMEFFMYVNQTANEAQYGSTTAVSSATPTSLSNYPRRIKMEEKREYPMAQSPYCQQMQVMDNGSIQSISTNTIEIKEVEPTPTTTIKGSGTATQTYTAKAQYQSMCYCISLTD